MEVIRKMEERSRGSCGRRVRVSSPKSLNKDVMESISKLLEEAQKSVQQMKSCLLEEEDEADLVVLDHHSSLILNSFQSLISMLKHSTHFNHSIQNAGIKQRKRRKSGESWSWETSDVVDDGHAWRKYGQKQILNTKYPRSYYRCSQKEDEKCEARKQVQQTSENPRKYSIIYHGLHTCKNKNTQNPSKSSKLLSFQISPTTTTLYPNPNPTEYSSMKDDHQLISAESETNYLELQYSSSDTHNHIIPSQLCTALSSPVSDDQGDHAISAFDDFINFINIHHNHYTATA